WPAWQVVQPNFSTGCGLAESANRSRRGWAAYWVIWPGVSVSALTSYFLGMAAAVTPPTTRASSRPAADTQKPSPAHRRPRGRGGAPRPAGAGAPRARRGPGEDAAAEDPGPPALVGRQVGQAEAQVLPARLPLLEPRARGRELALQVLRFPAGLRQGPHVGRLLLQPRQPVLVIPGELVHLLRQVRVVGELLPDALLGLVQGAGGARLAQLVGVLGVPGQGLGLLDHVARLAQQVLVDVLARAQLVQGGPVEDGAVDAEVTTGAAVVAGHVLEAAVVDRQLRQGDL